MKQFAVLLSVLVVAVVMVLGKVVCKEKPNDLLLMNIEALAAEEIARETCIGRGDLNCFSGIKVEYIIEHNILE
ncbi:NVEALA domain-containing protein [Phocaeicola sp.]